MRNLPPFRQNQGVTLVEVMVATAILMISMGGLIYAFTQGAQISKFQSVYETSMSYAEQAMEFALSTSYNNFSNTNSTSTVYVNPLPSAGVTGMLYSNTSYTNMIATKSYGGTDIVITNIIKLGTQLDLPLDDLGSYVTSRSVMIDRPSGADTNLDYVVITVSNSWSFLGRTQMPVVIRTIRNNPSVIE